MQPENWELAPTELSRAQAVRETLARHGITATRDVVFVLKVLDSHGLFHAPRLQPGWTGKAITRAAKAAASALRKKMRAGLETRVDFPTTDGARGVTGQGARTQEAALWLEAEKVRSDRYQTNRGGRLIPIGSHRRRRPEPEVTHALQLLDCHLRHVLKMQTGARLDSLASVLQAADNTQDHPDSNGGASAMEATGGEQA